MVSKLEEKIIKRTAVIGVIGMGYIGLSLLDAFGKFLPGDIGGLVTLFPGLDVFFIKVVEARGGQVLTLPFVPGYSTTELLNRIRSEK